MMRAIIMPVLAAAILTIVFIFLAAIVVLSASAEERPGPFKNAAGREQRGDAFGAPVAKADFMSSPTIQLESQDQRAARQVTSARPRTHKILRTAGT